MLSQERVVGLSTFGQQWVKQSESLLSTGLTRPFNLLICNDASPQTPFLWELLLTLPRTSLPELTVWATAEVEMREDLPRRHIFRQRELNKEGLMRSGFCCHCLALVSLLLFLFSG